MKRGMILCFFALLLPALAMAQQNGERKALNTFFSNFSETNLQSFKKDGLSDDAMLQFAKWHCVMNTPNAFKKDRSGATIAIPVSAIDKITQRYFGKTITAHREKSYQADLATGEAFVFSQADTVSEQQDGTLLVQGTIYYTGSGSTPDPHGTPQAWKKAGEDVRVYGTFTGLVAKVRTQEKERYVLVEYTMKEKM